MRAGTLVPATPRQMPIHDPALFERSMRAGTLVPATRGALRASPRTARPLNEGRNFSSGNTVRPPGAATPGARAQ